MGICFIFFTALILSLRELEDMAVGVIEECDDDNEQKTADLLTDKRDNWGGLSCIEVGLNGPKDLKFSSLNSVQRVLEEMWCGHLATRIGTWRVKYLCQILRYLSRYIDILHLCAFFFQIRISSIKCMDYTNVSFFRNERTF